MKKLLILILSISTFIKCYSQNIGINATGLTPDPSAILDVSATDKGMLIPRMTSAQRIAISSPASGLLVYDTDNSSFWFYNGTSWNGIGMAVSGSFNFNFKGSGAQGFNASVTTVVSFSVQNYLNNVTFTNSIFTAPSSGIYSFAVNLNIYGNAATSASMGFYVNNVARSASTFNIISGVFQHIGFTDNLSLTSGDQVTVQLQPSLYISGFANSFTGYKIN
jgi:hypothetical protein